MAATVSPAASSWTMRSCVALRPVPPSMSVRVRVYCPTSSRTLPCSRCVIPADWMRRARSTAPVGGETPMASFRRVEGATTDPRAMRLPRTVEATLRRYSSEALPVSSCTATVVPWPGSCAGAGCARAAVGASAGRPREHSAARAMA